MSTIVPGTDEKKELHILPVQTPHIQHAFSHLQNASLDETYRLNKLTSVTSCFLCPKWAHSSWHVYSALLNTFVRKNPSAEPMKPVAVGKDVTAISVWNIEEEFEEFETYANKEALEY